MTTAEYEELQDAGENNPDQFSDSDADEMGSHSGSEDDCQEARDGPNGLAGSVEKRRSTATVGESACAGPVCAWDVFIPSRASTHGWTKTMKRARARTEQNIRNELEANGLSSPQSRWFTERAAIRKQTD